MKNCIVLVISIMMVVFLGFFLQVQYDGKVKMKKEKIKMMAEKDIVDVVVFFKMYSIFVVVVKVVGLVEIL